MNAIIAGVDASDVSERAAIVAANLARAAGVPLELVHVLATPVVVAELPALATSLLQAEHRSWAEQRLADLSKKLAPTAPARVAMPVGAAANELVDRARSQPGALLVVGSTGAGFATRLVLGSTAHKVVHLAASPVLVVRGDGATSLRRFCVAVDESACAAKAARFAAELAAHVQGELALAYVSLPNLIPDIPQYHALLQQMDRDEEARVERILAGLRSELGAFKVPVTTARLVGGAETFIEWAEKSGGDCLVAGSRGRHAVARVMLGSFADRVLNASARNVLIVR